MKVRLGEAPCLECTNNDTCNVLQKVYAVIYNMVFTNCPDAKEV